MEKKLILGTAMWGWTINRQQAYALLDQFYQAGGRWVDTASNYPINRNPADFRAAENILSDWLRENNVADMRVIVKIGSIDNSGSPQNNLARSFLLMNIDLYRGLLGSNLSTLMIHWDNRADQEQIEETLRAFTAFREAGIQPGLSGIQSPEKYFTSQQFPEQAVPVQCKYNLFHNGIDHYQQFSDRAEFLLYGINGGGLKFDKEYTSGSSATVRGVAVDEKTEVLETIAQTVKASQTAKQLGVEQFNQVSLLHSWFEERASGIILGPSRPEHLRQSFEFIETIKKNPECRSLLEEIHSIVNSAKRSRT